MKRFIAIVFLAWSGITNTMSDGYVELDTKDLICNIPELMSLQGNSEPMHHAWDKIHYDSLHQIKANNSVFFRRDQIVPVDLYQTRSERYFYGSALENTSHDIIPGLPIHVEDPAITNIFAVRAWIVYDAIHKKHRRLHLYAGYNKQKTEEEDGQIMVWKAKPLYMNSYNCHDFADRNHLILSDKAEFLTVDHVARVVREYDKSIPHRWHNQRKRVLNLFVSDRPGIALDNTICPVNMRAYWPAHS